LFTIEPYGRACLSGGPADSVFLKNKIMCGHGRAHPRGFLIPAVREVKCHLALLQHVTGFNCLI
jgi:hypothetical protein